MNVSTMEITLIQARMTCGTEGSSSCNGFMSMLDQVMSATDNASTEQAGTNQGSSTEILLALLQQRSPSFFDPTALTGQGNDTTFGSLLNAISPTSQSSTDASHNNSAIADLLAQLFQLLDQASSLVADLYKQLPDDSVSSPWPRQTDRATPSVVDEAKNDNAQTTASPTASSSETTASTAVTDPAATATGTPDPVVSQQPLAIAA
ncbi:MAG: hypothetical protein HQL77_08080 [Magnetococcales bacterium]|nr:hypothetical protein [Magnetococcales bacterium]